MGKSSKKSATKVDAVVPAAKALKNGNRREAEEAADKHVSAKKQKTNEGVKQASQKEKAEKKTQKKKQESSSSEEDSSEEEKKVKPTKQNGGKTVETNVQKKKQESSSSEEDSSDEEPPKTSQQKITVVAPAKKGKEESSDESDDSSGDEDDETPAKAPVPATKKKADSSDDESDESSDEDEETPSPATKNVPVAASKQKADSSDDDDDDSDESSDEGTPAPATKNVPLKVAPNKTDSSDEDSDESSDEEATVTTNGAAQQKKMDIDEVDSDEVSDDDLKDKKAKGTVQKKSSSDDDSSDEDSESEEDSDDEKTSKIPKKNDADAEMVDAVTPKPTIKQSDFKKAPNTPATPVTAGSKTLFVGNLPYEVERADVENFFKDCGEIVDVRFSTDADQRFKGFGHVEFATVEAAQKAIELNGQILGGRDVRLDFAKERGERPAHTPYSGKEGNLFQKGGYGESKRLFVRGFDTSSGEDEIRNSLTEYFGKCGEVANISIPADYETGAVKGMAYIEFSDADGFNKALELNGSDYTVEEARPRNRDGGGGRSGGRSGGRGDGWSGGGRRGGRFGGGGRFSSGRDGGGRFSSGRDSSGRGRGRGFVGGRGFGGTPRPSVTSLSTGKKTTFQNDE